MAETTKKHKRIPITAAKRIAQEYNYDQVIVVAWNKKDNMYWTTTYGSTKEQCKQAAKGGKVIRELISDG